MKFDCGNDSHERSRIRNRELKERVKFLVTTWQLKFAWLPTRVSSFSSVEDKPGENKCVWLEWYERKLIPEYCSWSNRTVVSEKETLELNKWEVREFRRPPVDGL